MLMHFFNFFPLQDCYTAWKYLSCSHRRIGRRQQQDSTAGMKLMKSFSLSIVFEQTFKTEWILKTFWSENSVLPRLQKWSAIWISIVFCDKHWWCEIGPELSYTELVSEEFKRYVRARRFWATSTRSDGEGANAKSNAAGLVIHSILFYSASFFELSRRRFHCEKCNRGVFTEK